MGMSDPRTDLFKEKITSFQTAIDENDYDNSKKIFDQLNSLLHPNNHLRKLLKFQLIGLSNSTND